MRNRWKIEVWQLKIIENQALFAAQGLVSIPRHRFSETFAKFCFSTLRVRPEVVLALQGIKAMCHARLEDLARTSIRLHVTPI